MKNYIILSTLFLIFSPNIVFAKKDCPDLNGKYIVKDFSPIIKDAGNLLKINLINIKYGELEIKEIDNQNLSFFWKSDKLLNQVLTSSLNNLFL